MNLQTRKREAPSLKNADRRVARTQRRLREALHSLIHERDYDSIAVKEILDRADVGRSAFYMHFRDKDELLASTLEEMLKSIPSTRPLPEQNIEDRLLWFSLPVFEHLARLRKTAKLKLEPTARTVLHGHLQNVLASIIVEEVKKMFRGPRKSGEIPVDLLVRYIVSTFILVLDWWVESEFPLSPTEVNRVFRSLLIPTLNGILSSHNKQS